MDEQGKERVTMTIAQDSAGARLEREVAAAIGMEVHDLGEVL